MSFFSYSKFSLFPAASAYMYLWAAGYKKNQTRSREWRSIGCSLLAQISPQWEWTFSPRTWVLWWMGGCVSSRLCSVTSCWQLEVNRGGSIYSMKIGKHQGFYLPPLESQWLKICQHTTAQPLSLVALTRCFGVNWPESCFSKCVPWMLVWWCTPWANDLGRHCHLCGDLLKALRTPKVKDNL